ncbi:MAG: sulfur carrier protein ThiS [Paludibacteraceae bacterium]|nr:sulfur carrier protein ThiS [Prevotellaceae bacterium]
MEEKQTIKIFLNKKEISFDKEITIIELLEHLGKKPEGIAFAIGNKVIKRQDWGDTKIQDGNHVTMIKAVCGG